MPDKQHILDPQALCFDVTIPNGLVRLTSLTPESKLVFGLLGGGSYRYEDAFCKPDTDQMATELGMTTKQIQAAIEVLVQEKLLRLNRPGVYEFLWHECYDGGPHA